MTDWRRWSQDAVAMMQARNREWRDEFGLTGAAFRWDLETAQLIFPAAPSRREVVADLRLAGTVSSSAGTFLWSWANGALPRACVDGVERVRAFGLANDLPLLMKPELRAGRSEGLEMLAIAGRVLDAAGVFVDEIDDVTLFFVILRFSPFPD